MITLSFEAVRGCVPTAVGRFLGAQYRNVSVQSLYLVKRGDPIPMSINAIKIFCYFSAPVRLQQILNKCVADR